MSDQVDNAAKLADLERRLANTEEELSVYRNRGLRGFFSGSGYQYVGENNIIFSKYGMQLVPATGATGSQIAFYREPYLTSGNPSDYGLVYSDFPSATEHSMGVSVTDVDQSMSAGWLATLATATNNTVSAQAQAQAGTWSHTLQQSARQNLDYRFYSTVQAGGSTQSFDHGGILTYPSTPLAITNTTTETAVLSQALVANLLGTSRGLRATVGGTYLNNDGAARNLTIRVKFGTTTMWADTVSFSNSATSRAWRLQVEMFNAVATNDQRMVGQIAFSSATAAATGDGNWEAPAGAQGPIAGSAAEDTTAAKTFSITVEHGTASNNLSITRTVGVLELL